MENTVPYILLFGSLSLLAWWHYSASTTLAKRRISIISFAIMLLFFGFRGFCFYDWTSYFPLFEGIKVNNIGNINLLKTEPGFALLMYLCKTIYPKYWFFVFVCSAINLSLLLCFLRERLSNLPLALMIYLCFGGLFFMTDLMRNSIAALIFINGLKYIVGKKPIQYFAICTLAISFHYSSIVYLPCYFFLNKEIKVLWLSIIFGLGSVVFALHLPIVSSSILTAFKVVSPALEEKIHWYLTEVSANSASIDIVFFERMITGFLVLFFIKKLRGIRTDSNIYINAIFLYYFFAFYLSEFVSLSSRMSLLFSFGYWILWNDIIKCFSYNNNRKLFVLFLLLYCCARTIGLTKSVLAQYDNILLDSESYQRRVSIFNKVFRE